MRVSNKLRSFFIVLLSIVVVMAALPLQALKVNADGQHWVYYENGDGWIQISTNDNGDTTILDAADEQLNISKEGCVFWYWYRNNDPSLICNVGETINLDDDLYLKAKWVKARTVTFDANYPDDATGRTGNMQAQTLGEGLVNYLNANQFSCKEYSFAGWQWDSRC